MLRYVQLYIYIYIYIYLCIVMYICIYLCILVYTFACCLPACLTCLLEFLHLEVTGSDWSSSLMILLRKSNIWSSGSPMLNSYVHLCPGYLKLYKVMLRYVQLYIYIYIYMIMYSLCIVY